MTDPVLEFSSISKHFGAIHALDDIDLTFERGEVIGLMGDNGAGKSTLVKIIAGNFQPSHGRIRLNGQEIRFADSKDARDHGIEVVYRISRCATISPPPTTSFSGARSGDGSGLCACLITGRCRGARRSCSPSCNPRPVRGMSCA